MHHALFARYLHKAKAAAAQLSHTRRRLGTRTTVQLLCEEAIREFNLDWVRAFENRSFDRRHQVRTAGFFTMRELGLAERALESHNYRGTPVALFDAALADAQIDPSEFEFVDYGSGMGKALLLAARHPFRRITGVECSPELHAIAERNIANWCLPEQRCSSVRCLLADAESFLLPEGNCLLYFFNPFRHTLLRSVIHRIVEQAKRPIHRGHMICIVYIAASFRNVFEEFPELRLVARAGIRQPLYDVFFVQVDRGDALGGPRI